MTGSVVAETRPDRLTMGAFLLFVILAGGNVVAVRYVTCEACELEPFWAAGSRFAAAALVLFAIAAVVRAGMPRGRALLGAVVYGVLGFAAPLGLAYWGFQHASAGTGAVLLATMPLLTLVFAVAHRQEPFRRAGLFGGLLALAGIAAIFSEGIDRGIPVTSLLAFLGAAACFAETNIVVKAFPPVHPVAMNAVGLAVAGGLLLVLSVLVGEAIVIPDVARTWLAQGYLVLLGSVLVFPLYVFVIHRWTASAVSYDGVLIPLVGIALAALLQDERITSAFAAGSALVLAGVYVGALRGSGGPAAR